MKDRIDIGLDNKQENLFKKNLPHHLVNRYNGFTIDVELILSE